MVKNIDLITNEVQDFSLIKLKFITTFSVSYYKEFSENKSLLEIDFVIEDDTVISFK